MEYLKTLGLKYTIVDAALLGDIKFMREKLSENPGLIGDEGPLGDSPLHAAAGAGQIEVVRSLLSYGAIVDATDTAGFTPLFSAVYGNKVEVARILLGKGADPNATALGGITPLHCAALAAGKPMLELLLKYGAKVNTVSEVGSTPLGRARASGNEEKIRFLKEHGAVLGPRDKQRFGADPSEPDIRAATPTVDDATSER